MTEQEEMQLFYETPPTATDLVVAFTAAAVVAGVVYVATKKIGNWWIDRKESKTQQTIDPDE